MSNIDYTYIDLLTSTHHGTFVSECTFTKHISSKVPLNTDILEFFEPESYCLIRN